MNSSVLHPSFGRIHASNHRHGPRLQPQPCLCSPLDFGHSTGPRNNHVPPRFLPPWPNPARHDASVNALSTANDDGRVRLVASVLSDAGCNAASYASTSSVTTSMVVPYEDDRSASTMVGHQVRRRQPGKNRKVNGIRLLNFLLLVFNSIAHA